MGYSPRPDGYYVGACNKPIDASIDLSIIVPIYNVECYLEECLGSIINQVTRYRFEIICVDDGSPDNSIDILRKYEKNYSVVKVIRQKNRGLSGARNRGLDEATGKYVMFVDSDDRLAPNAIELLVDEVQKEDYDIVCSGFCTFTSAGAEKRYCDTEETVVGNAYGVMSRHQCYFWGKVYKRSFWDNIRLPEGYLFEDMQVLHVLTRLCNGYSYIAKPLYEYRMNPDGISSTAPANPKSIDQYWMVEYIEEEINRLSLVKDDKFYAALLKELGPYLYGRTRLLPDEIRMALFSVAADKVINWNVNSKELTISGKRLLNAFCKKDFYLWEVTAQCWHS